MQTIMEKRQGGGFNARPSVRIYQIANAAPVPPGATVVADDTPLTDPAVGDGWKEVGADYAWPAPKTADAPAPAPPTEGA